MRERRRHPKAGEAWIRGNGQSVEIRDVKSYPGSVLISYDGGAMYLASFVHEFSFPHAQAT